MLRHPRTKRLLEVLNSSNKRIVHPSAQVTISEKAKHVRGRIEVGRNSVLTIQEGAHLDSDLSIGDDCILMLGPNSRIRDVDFSIDNNSTVELGEGAIIDSPVSHRSSVTVDNGSLKLAQCSHVMSTDILVRFGGKMSIGRYTGIAYRSEIRCEELVEIGAYGMISYDVCIYDTNTHSVDWRERRARIEASYPEGVMETLKPATSPVFIGDDVWIGKEVAITKGANIGHRCIIGIRTIIGNETVPDDSVVVSGKPRIITRKPEETNTTPFVRVTKD